MGPQFVHDFLLRSAKCFPDKEFIVQAGRRATYGEILAEARAVEAWLREDGIEAGDRVGILLDAPCEYVASYFGILLAGATVVALNTQTSTRTLTSLLSDCRVSRLFTHRKFWKYVGPVLPEVPSLRSMAMSGGLPEGGDDAPVAVATLQDVLRGTFACPGNQVPVPELKPPNPGPGKRNSELRSGASAPLAQIIYTSGTTADPKGVMLTHANLVANTLSTVQYLELTARERLMTVLPFFYSYGNSLLLTHAAVGGTLVVNQSLLYPNVVLEQMLAEEVTGFSGVPSTFAILLNRSAIRERRFPHLRYVTQAGGAMSPKHASQVREALPDTDVYIMYGQTEAAPRLSYLPPEDLERKAGSIGVAIPGVELQVLDPAGNPVAVGEVGEIVARGPNVMAGYWDKPEATAQVLREEGLWTGDLARFDEDGYLYIVSRKSDMIKSGAHRIAPREIEEVILEYPAVRECAVVGSEDEILGESIKAVVVLKEGAHGAEKQLVLHCRRNLPAFKVPHEVEFRDELPKTASGKVKKGELK